MNTRRWLAKADGKARISWMSIGSYYKKELFQCKVLIFDGTPSIQNAFRSLKTEKIALGVTKQKICQKFEKLGCGIPGNWA